MPKVCHLSSAHYGLDIRIFRKECVTLARAGFDTHLVINGEPGHVADAAGQGVTLHPLERVPDGRRLSRMLFQARRCYEQARDVDAEIYHLHDPELIPYGVLLARAGKKVILDAHEDLQADVLSKDWIPLPARRPVSALCSRLEDAGAARFSAVVAATPFIGARFANKSRRVVVVNNYPMSGELADGSPEGDVQRDGVCYVGGIDAIRGIREMVRAIAQTPALLRLAGSFSTPDLHEEVRGYEGWRRVREYGFVDRAGVAGILARSFAGLVTLYPVPNFVNSQPIKMFEYMSAGVPVIASNFALWRDVIERNDCGICVNPHDPAAISSAIRYLHDHPEEVERMGRNGKEAAERHYRWESEEKKLVSLYRDILADG